MKVLVLYRPNSEQARVVEEFVRNFRARHDPEQLELLDIDTREGSRAAQLYGVMQYPTVLVVQTDGTLQRSWEGETLPLVDEVVSYARG
jgi:hypothetical protein